MSDDDRDADADATAGKVDSTKIVKRSDPMKGILYCTWFGILLHIFI